MKNPKIIFLTILTLFPLLFSCSKETISISATHMGTLVTITVRSNSYHIKICPARQAISLAFYEISRIEKLMSPYIEESDIYRINNGVSKTAIKISPETFTLIEKSQKLSEKSQGAFDITFVPLSRLYDYKNPNFEPPSLDDIEKIKHLVNYKNLILNSEHHEIVKKYDDVNIGLGSIAKGYAIEQAVGVLRENGVKSAIVEIGGDLQVIGSNAGKAWTTGLVNPRKKEIMLSVSLKNNEGIATSGDYERYVEYDGERYHHILNPKTGKPAKAFASVSVISKDMILADAYSTAIFVMGLERALEFLKDENDVLVIMMDINMNIYVSKKLRGQINFLYNHKVNWI